MKRFKKLLVAVDTRMDQHPVVDFATEIAAQNASSVSIVDVVPDIPWIASKLAGNLEPMRAFYAQEALARLESIAAPIRDSGVDVTTNLLTGKASVEIVREVLRKKHDLVVAVAKGKSSARKGFFGYTASRLLQTCPSAVWLIPDHADGKFKHVLGCVDVSSDQSTDTELNATVYELSSSISEWQSARHSVLHAWRMLDEALLSKRLDRETVSSFVREHREEITKWFDEFLKNHGSRVGSQNAHLIQGRAPETIETFVRENSVDLVVMGTVARSGLAGLLIGNTAQHTLDRIACSVLAVKPENFVSPIRLAPTASPISWET